MTSLARQVVVLGTSVLVGTLLAVGLATGAALHAEQVRALDRTLLAAAHERAHPDTDDRVEVEHSRSPVRAWIVEPGDLPRALAERAEDSERPVWARLGDDRVLILPFEVYSRHGEEHALVAASAPWPTPARTVGAFVLLYMAVASAASVVAALVLGAGVRRAFLPLERARAEAARASALSRDERLTVAGPDEVRGLLDALNGLLDRRDTAFRAQGRFTAEAAHELRTPVAAMLGELDVALRRARDAQEYERVLVSVREEVERLRRLVEGLTTLARLDAGHAEADRELVRAREIAEASLRAEGVDAELIVAADPELEVHRALVETALGNLLRNAARHAAGTPIVLTVGEDGFTVDDGGPGLDEAEREAVFARFARGGEARRSDRHGLGLGLPLAREIARRHGGDVTLSDAPGGGLRATLRVRDVQARLRAEATRAQRAAGGHPGPGRV